jgi:hypothetical protein
MDEAMKEAKRHEIVRVAQSEVGPQTRGSEKVLGYWRTVLPSSWSEAQVKQFANSVSWCGGFALWCLRQAGIAKDTAWQMGRGFIGPAGLPRTKQPRPGDIAYTDQPKQHHAIVESLIDNTLVTIDGNQPDIKRKSRPLPSGIVFYSIEPFLDKA